MPSSAITGTGYHQPERVLTNDDLARLVETNDEWIQRRTGIRERRIAAPEEQVADLAVPAGRMALTSAGLAPEELDMVIVATCSARDRCPSTASETAGRIGATSAVCFDVNNACAGFSTALGIADAAVQAGQARNALVIGAEKLSDVTDWTDRSSCILLGDGAGAAVVSAGEAPGVFPTVWGTDTSKRDSVTIRGAWDATFTQSGPEVFRWATTAMVGVAREAVERAGLGMDDVGALVTHQANLRIIEPLAERIGLGHAIVARDVIHSGNTSAASVPLALAKLSHAGEIPSGTPTLLLAFGGGLSWAAQVVLAP
jgi:3-oxoacyl-[acyl-carrier-protein] synthase-3